MRIYRSGKYYYVEYRTLSGPRRQSTGKTDRREADRFIDECDIAAFESAAGVGIMAATAVSNLVSGRKVVMLEAVSEFGRSMLNNASSRKTIANYQEVLHRWLKHQKIAGLQPALVDAERIAQFINDPHSRSKASTRKVWLSAIASLFSFMRAKGWTMRDPSAEVAIDYSILSHDQKEESERRPIEESEYRKIVEDCQCRFEYFWEYATRIGWETGLRLVDACSLEWASLSIPMHVVVWDQKTNTRVQHQISEAVVNLIEEHGDKDGRFIFPVQRSMALDPRTRSKLSTHFGRILKRCGINGVSYHCLRHSRASREMGALDKESLAKELAERLTVDQVRRLMGHASAENTKKYIHDK